jgi:hypothetical protein
VHFTRPMSSLIWWGWKDSRKTAKWRPNVSRDCRCVRENYNVVLDILQVHFALVWAVMRDFLSGRWWIFR